jgi:spermidine/putrescine transport system permease protein
MRTDVTPEGRPRLTVRHAFPWASKVDSVVLAFPAALGMLIFVVTPLIVFAGYSLLTSGLYEVSRPWTLANYRDVIGNHTNVILARNSLFTGFLVGAFTVLIALPVAYWLRYCAGRVRGLVVALIVISFLASYLVRIYAWRTVLGTTGVVNKALMAVGVIHHPLGFLLFNRTAVVIALVHIFLPYAILVMYAAFIPFDARYLEACEDLGATRVQQWRKLILPVIAAPAATLFMFILILASGDYVTPQLLGGTNGEMIGVQIQNEFQAVGDWGAGAALSFTMLAAFLACAALIRLALYVGGVRDVKLEP